MTDLQVLPVPAEVEVKRPLCVDLDGTLVKSDTLVDSLLMLARRHPAAFLQTPLWAMQSKAFLKAQVASRVVLEAAYLPYNLPLVEYLRAEHAAGRKLYLATGADRHLAERIADHLGIFAGVMASDGAVNLTGENKLQQLQQQFAGFDYIGNAIPDLPLLQAAKNAMLANPAMRLRSALKREKVTVTRCFEDRSPAVVSLGKALRVHQWAKNLLVFLPLLLAHTLSAASLLKAAAAFLCFCFTASATYIVNDLLDLQTDRMHLQKRTRAFAAGNLSAAAGLWICLVLLIAALAVATRLPPTFGIYLLLYLVTTLAYSITLKRIVLVDVVILSSLYTIRMMAGSSATHTPISPWLAAFSVFLFLSLAMVKRFQRVAESACTRRAPQQWPRLSVSGHRANAQLRYFKRVRVHCDFCAVHQWARGCGALSSSQSHVADYAAADLVGQPGLAAGLSWRTGRGSSRVCAHRSYEPAAGCGCCAHRLVVAIKPPFFFGLPRRAHRCLTL